MVKVAQAYYDTLDVQDQDIQKESCLESCMVSNIADLLEVEAVLVFPCKI